VHSSYKKNQKFKNNTNKKHGKVVKPRKSTAKVTKTAEIEEKKSLLSRFVFMDKPIAL
jgi:hypothetical protein